MDMRLTRLTLAVCFLVCLIAVDSACAADRPNFVVIIADDQAFGDFGFMGNEHVRTPHLDRLAAQSARYPNGYIPTSVCRPSLATLLTGLYPHQHGIHFNHPPPGLNRMRRMSGAQYVETRAKAEHLIRESPTLPRVLARHGYVSFQAGKHWEGDYRNAGFTHGMTTGRAQASDKYGTRPQANGDRVAHGNGDAGLAIGRDTMKPVYDFIDQHADKQPFLVWYAPFLPHTPFDAPKQFKRPYEFAKGLPQHLVGYYASITRFDATVGDLVSHVERKGLADNTVFIFVVDNGYRPKGSGHYRDENKRSKWSPYENGVRTPILIRWDGHAKPATHDGLVQSVDIAPTILAAAGVAERTRPQMPGIDLIPSACGQQPLPNRAAFGAVWPNDASVLGQPSRDLLSRWVRSGDYKLIVSQEKDDGRYLELFNLATDSAERRNLARDTDQSPRIARLLAMLDDWWTPSASTLMLKLPDFGTDPAKIDFQKLPRVPRRHAVISDVRDRGGKRVNQHAYLAHYAGRYWAIWSDGPGVPVTTADKHRNRVPGHDQPGTRVSFATSKDGLTWSRPADLSGPPRRDGFGWIARGLWVRDGQLLALASHFNAPGYPGKGLSLEAFRWDSRQLKWVAHGTVFDDTLNNFPPKMLPNGQWMMTRRDHERQVSVLVGGVDGFNKWQVKTMAAYGGTGRPEEPYWYVLPNQKTLVGLIRDNSGSKRLLRTVSEDNGQTWSDMVKTNFPDATSKFFVLRTSRGYYVMVSNANPRRRDPLTLAVSRDGVVFTHLFYLVGGRHIDYPHIIEHDGQLLIAFSGAKQTVEVIKVALTDIDALIDGPSAPTGRPAGGQ